MTRKLWILALVLGLAMAMTAVLAACADDDDDDDDDSGDDDDDDDIFGDDDDDAAGDDDDSGTDCENNNAPVIGPGVYVIDASTQVLADEFTDTVDPTNTDFSVCVVYDDRPSCNLLGGEIFVKLQGEEYASLGALDAEAVAQLGCSTDESGFIDGCWGLNADPDTGLLPEGTYTWATKWTDGCAAESNEVTGSFTVSATK